VPEVGSDHGGKGRSADHARRVALEHRHGLLAIHPVAVHVPALLQAELPVEQGPDLVCRRLELAEGPLDLVRLEGQVHHQVFGARRAARPSSPLCSGGTDRSSFPSQRWRKARTHSTVLRHQGPCSSKRMERRPVLNRGPAQVVPPPDSGP